ncbi:hypothetical protein ACFWP0_10425 [Achromobacter sp. NPDC058515]|uniref:hypothetical protein n=1 Tax=Achromobacter sp. NPDC058515 TaxID=3346533 RepID=UPI00366A1F40
MSKLTFSRCGVLLLLVALVSGCSSVKPGPAGPKGASASASAAHKSDQCKGNRSKCLYKGAYEPGEKDYAEQEAKRLNLAEVERLRRIFGK